VRTNDATEVAVVRWRAEAVARTLLAREGKPRVLVVSSGAAAPAPVADLEDWLRDPVDPVELLARSEALRRRVAARVVAPWLDDDGLLHHEDRWVSIPDSQLPMVELLVARFGQLVRTDELAAAYTAAGGSENRSSIRTAIVRVRSRVSAVGLSLRAARQRGVVLEANASDRR
jgi:DNA-binding response OmpR family regulator